MLAARNRRASLLKQKAMYTKSNIEKAEAKLGISAPCKSNGTVVLRSEYNQIFANYARI